MFRAEHGRPKLSKKSKDFFDKRLHLISPLRRRNSTRFFGKLFALHPF